MTEPRRIVLDHLAAAARARRRRRASQALASAISLVAGLLITATLALAVAPSLRPWMLVALGSVAAVGLGAVLAAFARRERPLATAAWIARRDPAFGGALADAVEFGDLLQRGAPIPTGSSELASAHLRAAAGSAREADPAATARSLPAPPWRSALGLLGGALLVLLAVPSGRSILLHGPPPPAPPRVTYGAVQLTHRHPAYLRLPDRVEVSAGDVEAPVGTHVEVQVRADRALASARLEPDGGAPIEMSVEGDTATGRLVVTRDGSYRIVLRGAAGELDPQPPTHVVRAIPDASPSVRLRAPRQDVVLDEGESLAVDWTATDDHGVSAAALVVMVGLQEDEPPEPGAEDQGATRVDLGTFDPPEKDRAGRGAFTTDDLGLGPGDSGWLWVEARDDDAVTGPKWDASSRVRVTVRSEREEQSEIDRGQQELAERLLRLLGTHLVASADRLPDAAAVARHHEAFLPGVTAAAGLAESLATATRDEMSDFAAATALQDMRARLDSLARARARRAEALLSGDPAQALGAHGDLFDREIEELERDVLFFDMWADRRASLRATDAAEELLRAAAELQQRAAQDEPEATAEELAASASEVAQAAEPLQEMLQQLAEAAGADPAAAAEAKRLLDALRQASRSLSQKLERGDRSSAERDAARMEELADELAGRVADLADEGAAGDPELAREIEQAEAELRRLRREQADLRDRTNAVRDEMRRALSPEDLQRAQEGFEELQRLAREAVQAHARADEVLSGVDQVAEFFKSIEERGRREARMREILSSDDVLTPAQAAEIRDLQEQVARDRRAEMLGYDLVEGLMRGSMASRELLGRTSQAIGDRDLQAARVPARWAHDQLSALREDASADSDMRAAVPDLTTAVARTAELIERLEELQDQLEQAASQAMTAGQRGELAEAGQRQAQVQQKARELASKLRDLSADAPFLGEGVADQVDEAGGFMDEATRGLFGRRPGQASEDQGEALARLDQAADAMSGSGNREDGQSRSGASGKEQPGQRPGGQRPGGREGGQEGRDGRRGRTSRERVEIPDADDFKVPKEFREEILEAMRESSAPEGYEEQVREYYRRLVE